MADALFEYTRQTSLVLLKVRILPSLESDSIPSSSLPTLTLKWGLFATELCWYTPRRTGRANWKFRGEFQGERTHRDQLLLVDLPPSLYMSDIFYSVLQENLTTFCEEFHRIYRYHAIRDVISKVREFAAEESHKGHQNMMVLVRLGMAYHGSYKERGCAGLFEVSPRMGLAERMEIDEDECMNDDCVICVEELGKEGTKIFCMPCSHMFHGHCISKWLEKTRSCPICRYEMPLPESGS